MRFQINLPKQNRDDLFGIEKDLSVDYSHVNLREIIKEVSASANKLVGLNYAGHFERNLASYTALVIGILTKMEAFPEGEEIDSLDYEKDDELLAFNLQALSDEMVFLFWRHEPNNKYPIEKSLTEEEYRKACSNAIKKAIKLLSMVRHLSFNKGLSIHHYYSDEVWDEDEDEGFELSKGQKELRRMQEARKRLEGTDKIVEMELEASDS